MHKFQVGDRVIGTSDYMGVQIKGKLGTVKGFGSLPKDPIGVEFDENVDGHSGGSYFSGKQGHCWYVPENHVSVISSPQSIHITTDGNTTHAVLKDGGKVTRRAKAVCSPDDKFDFATGARIALERLTGTKVAVAEATGTVREVKRPAKVGECVRMVCDMGGDLNPGTIHKCTGSGVFGNIWHCSVPSNYVVLEGYEPPKKPDNPKYYSGKVVCVESDGYWGSQLEVGRVYVVENGRFVFGNGVRSNAIYTSLPGTSEPLVHAKVIEFKGDAK